MDWERGVFFHFGIRTFYEGHQDWDMKEMSLSSFNPTKLDCTQWISAAKEAGFKYAILVCKHHDGFANWPSKYTAYSVANTPWENGNGDVVQNFCNACRQYGLKVGVYYSPAEFGSKDKEHKDYDEYFINQVSELLTSYGVIDYLWFDGCGSEGHEYDWGRIIAEIRRLQPDILIFGSVDPDTRWIGNESGYAHSPNHNIVAATEFSVQTNDMQTLAERRFLPAECDVRMRLHSWFYSNTDEHTVKSVEELMGIYYYSVGRGANLLINIGPDRRGLLPDADRLRLLEFGAEIRRRFAIPLVGAQVQDYDCLVFTSNEPALVSHVILTESLDHEDPIEAFTLRAYPYTYGYPITIYEGRTIGHKAICQFPPFLTQKIEILVSKPERLTGFTVYCFNPRDHMKRDSALTVRV
jgi:alpha-L-fucosidase